MKAVVMAGGEGSRLRPLTIGRPKPMVPIMNRPVMEHILELLKRHDIHDIVVTVQYLAGVIQNYFGDGSAFGVKIRYSVEDTPLGTAGSVKNAEDYLDEPFLVISGDALTDFDLTEIIRFHQERRAMATLTLTRVPNPLEYGVIITEEDGTIRQFLEKPSWSEVFSDTVNTGIYVLDPAIFRYFEAGVPFDFSKDLFPLLLKNKDPLYGFIAPGYWCDVGNIMEFVRANADFLRDKVNLPKPGQHIGGDIWVDEEVDIDADAQLFGPVLLGHGVKVRKGAIIHGPSVIGDYTIIDEKARLERVAVWNHSYIGERAEVRGAIICQQCTLKNRSMVFEGAVIGSGTIIGEETVVQPNVKIWPNKEVEMGSTVTTSLIWGAQGRRTLFGRHGVTGLVNIDLTPEFAAKLGAAFGATLPIGSTVTVNRDAHHTPRMIKRALISGLPSAGVNAADTTSVPVPVARYATRVSKSAGGIHVRLSPHDNRVIAIKFFDRNGLDLDRNTERKIENVFFREDFRRVYLDEIARISYFPDVLERYTEGFMAHINADVVRRAGFHLVVDYASASSSTVLPPILNRCGCDVVALNASIDEMKLFRTQEQFAEELERLASITATLRADLGVRLDPGGEKIYLVDDEGKILTGAQALAVMTTLVLRGARGGIVAVPVTAPSIIEEIAARHGGQVIRTRVDARALMVAATREGVRLVGDGDGLFIFPEFHPGGDGLMAVMKLLELMATQGTRLTQLTESLPHYFTAQVKVPCPWEEKGKVMRILNERYKDAQSKQIDGVKIDLGRQWVLILPDADQPLFHVFAEGTSPQQASELADRYAGILTEMR